MLELEELRFPDGIVVLRDAHDRRRTWVLEAGDTIHFDEAVSYVKIRRMKMKFPAWLRRYARTRDDCNG